ncbi:MAG TPA: hypothetical protein VNO76_00205 [Thermoplasmata archaeon]|nr:hypothetical protein [Thermoplasmata archaeon]
MARRKRKDDDPEWTAPEFDEVGYMRTEIQAARAAVIVIAWAVVGAFVAFLLFSVHPAVAFVAGIAVAFGLYFVFPMLGIQVSGFKRRDWTTHGITYFFSWLAFWILLLNPPFGDFTPPTIQAVSVSPYYVGYLQNTSHSLSCLPLVSGSVSVQFTGLNNSFYILFRATDNVGLRSLKVSAVPQGGTGQNLTLTPIAQSGFSRCAGHQTEQYPAGTYNVSFVPAVSAYDITIVAVDMSGLGASESFRIQYR